MRSLLVPFCLVAMVATATAESEIRPPPPPIRPLPPPIYANTCAATSCFRGSVCRIVLQGGITMPRCLNASDIPEDGNSRSCGGSGHPLLIAQRRGFSTVYKVFRCQDVCTAFNFVFLNGHCCPSYEKPGRCPAKCENLIGVGVCISVCHHDNDCKDNMKCCSNGCGMVCRSPESTLTCATVRCSAGHRCVQTGNGPKCVPFRPPCPVARCPFPVGPRTCNSSCRNDSDCNSNQSCCSLCGCRRCMAPAPTPTPTPTPGSCATVRCAAGHRCVQTGNGPKCVPFRPPCPVARCPFPVGPRTCNSSCRNDSDCRSNQSCCSLCGCSRCMPSAPTGPTCATVRCSAGHRCVQTGNGPKCVPFRPPCPVASCPFTVGPRTCNSSCRNDSDCNSNQSCCSLCGCRRCMPPAPTPTPTPGSCATVGCAPGHRCIETGNGPKCIPFRPPCPMLTCPLQAYSPKPCKSNCRNDNDCNSSQSCCYLCSCSQCMPYAPPPPPPSSCANVKCKKGDTCVMLTVQCVKAPCPQIAVCREICKLPPVQGMCKAHIPSYYYDKMARQCKKFVYGGCGGNPNRFKTQDECEEFCNSEDDD